MSPQGWHVGALRAELGIADRTYRKLRQTLVEEISSLTGRSGIEVREVKEEDGTYLRIVQPVPCSDHQALERLGALYMAQQIFGLAGDVPFTVELQSAAKDVERAVRKRPGLAQRVERLSRMLHYVPWAPVDYRGKTEIIRSLLHALLDRRRVTMEYQGREDAAPVTWTVEPYTLVLHRDALYVVARGVDREAPLTFAVARIGRLDVREDTFAYPRDFDPAKYFAGCFGIFRGEPGADAIRVELTFAADPGLQRYVRERVWHPTQEFSPQPDGSLRMSLRVTALPEVMSWARGFGDQVRIDVTEQASGSRAPDQD